MAADRPNLLIVAGHERSGSTLLHRMLARDLAGVAAGELRYAGSYLGTRRRCGCGAPLGQCSVWEATVQRLSRSELDALRLGPKVGGLGPAVSHTMLRKRRAGRDAYLRAYVSLCRELAHQHRSDLIVDSSGGPAHALLVARAWAAAGTPVHVVVLRKRFVDYLRSIDKRRHSHGGHYRRRRIASNSLRYVAQVLLPAVLTMVGIGHTTVRFDRWLADASRRHEVVARSAVGTGSQPIDVTDEWVLDVSHSAAGSPSRFESGSVVARAAAERP